MALRLVVTGDSLDAVELRIAEADDRVTDCRRAMAASRAAIVAGSAALLLALGGVGALRTPAVVFAAVAAVIGGTVWLGASKSSLLDATTERDALQAARERMIDEVASRNGWRDLTPTVH